jgi:hypothetical protein
MDTTSFIGGLKIGKEVDVARWILQLSGTCGMRLTRWLTKSSGIRSFKEVISGARFGLREEQAQALDGFSEKSTLRCHLAGE